MQVAPHSIGMTKIPKPKWYSSLQKLPLVSHIREKSSMKRYNTWRIGGIARCLIEVQTIQDLQQILPFIAEHEIPWFVLGKGSNLLIPDQYWSGIILQLAGEFKEWQILCQQGKVYTGAGLADVAFARKCANRGWKGLEFLIGIPGTLGGAIAMNAGAHGMETADCLQSVRWMNMEGTLYETPISELKFSYRNSSLSGRQGRIIIGATFQLTPENPETVLQSMAKCHLFRFHTQPRKQPSCGSVFKNPEGDHAARLIEVSGLKGKQQGLAQVSSQHSNFIVNLGGASSQDIFVLMDLIQNQIWSDHQVFLEPEVQVLSSHPHHTLPTS